jgi:hypothetical protein
LAWTALKVKFFQSHLFDPTAEYLLVGETIVSKAGHSTHGLGRFYSGLKKQVIKGLSFFVFSLVNVNECESSLLAVKQTIKEKGEKSDPLYEYDFAGAERECRRAIELESKKRTLIALQSASR